MQIQVTLNPDAVEIIENGRCVGTIRRDWFENGEWCLVIPAESGAASVSYEMMKLVIGFIDARKVS